MPGRNNINVQWAVTALILACVFIAGCEAIYFTRVSQDQPVNSPGAAGAMGIFGATYTPSAREATHMWNSVRRRYNIIYLFGGVGISGSGQRGFLNDFWSYDLTNGSWAFLSGSLNANQSGTVGTYRVPGNTFPSARAHAGVARMSTVPCYWGGTNPCEYRHNGELWLFGGLGFAQDGSFGALNDLYHFNESTMLWTWEAGGTTSNERDGPTTNRFPGGRWGHAMWINNDWAETWIQFTGGKQRDDEYYNSWWMYHNIVRQWLLPTGAYAKRGISLDPNAPGKVADDGTGWLGARAFMTHSTAFFGNYFYGGIGYASDGTFGEMNEIWNIGPYVTYYDGDTQVKNVYSKLLNTVTRCVGCCASLTNRPCSYGGWSFGNNLGDVFATAYRVFVGGHGRTASGLLQPYAVHADINQDLTLMSRVQQDEINIPYGIIGMNESSLIAPTPRQFARGVPSPVAADATAGYMFGGSDGQGNYYNDMYFIRNCAEGCLECTLHYALPYLTYYTGCTKCDNSHGYFYHLPSQVCQTCPDGWYGQVISPFTCVVCTQTFVATCKGPGPQDSTSCQASILIVLNNGTCERCDPLGAHTFPQLGTSCQKGATILFQGNPGDVFVGDPIPNLKVAVFDISGNALPRQRVFFNSTTPLLGGVLYEQYSAVSGGSYKAAFRAAFTFQQTYFLRTDVGTNNVDVQRFQSAFLLTTGSETNVTAIWTAYWYPPMTGNATMFITVTHSGALYALDPSQHAANLSTLTPVVAYTGTTPCLIFDDNAPRGYLNVTKGVPILLKYVHTQLSGERCHSVAYQFADIPNSSPLVLSSQELSPSLVTTPSDTGLLTHPNLRVYEAGSFQVDARCYSCADESIQDTSASFRAWPGPVLLPQRVFVRAGDDLSEFLTIGVSNPYQLPAAQLADFPITVTLAPPCIFDSLNGASTFTRTTNGSGVISLVGVQMYTVQACQMTVALGDFWSTSTVVNVTASCYLGCQFPCSEYGPEYPAQCQNCDSFNGYAVSMEGDACVRCVLGQFVGLGTGSVPVDVSQCKPCSNGCKMCNGSGLAFPTVCQACADDWMLDLEGSSCIAACPRGQYLPANETLRQCIAVFCALPTLPLVPDCDQRAGDALDKVPYGSQCTVACREGWAGNVGRFECQQVEFNSDNTTFVPELPICTECSLQYLSADRSQCLDCPNGVAPVPHSTSITTCLCFSGFYESPKDSGICVPCPPVGAVCPGSKQPYGAAPGYFLSDSGVLVACNPSVACGGGFCTAGYEGYLCATCSFGYYKLNSVCYPCPEDTVTKVTIGSLILLFIVLFLAFVATPGTGDNRFFSFATPTIFLSFVQITATFVSLKFPWAQKTRDMFDIASSLNINLQIVNPECIASFTVYQKAEVLLVMPVALAGLYIVVFFIYAVWIWLRHKAERSHFRLRLKKIALIFAAAFILFLTLAYLVLAEESIGLLSCNEQADGVMTLVSSPGDQCFTEIWWNHVPLAIFGIVVYVVALPLFMIFFYPYMRYSRGVVVASLHPITNFYVRKFESTWWPWEVLVMVRKLLIVVFSLLLSDRPLVQAVAFAMVLFVSCLLTVAIRPYLWKTHDTAEIVALVGSLLVLMSGFIINSPGATTLFVGNLDTIVVAVIGITTVILFFCLLAEIYVKWRILAGVFGRRGERTASFVAATTGLVGGVACVDDHVITVTDTGTVALWKVPSDKSETATLKATIADDLAHAVVAATMVQRRSLGIVGGPDGEVIFYDMSEQDTVGRLSLVGSGAVTCLATDGPLLTVGQASGQVTVFRLVVKNQSGSGSASSVQAVVAKQMTTVKGHTSPIVAVLVSGRMVVSADSQGHVAVSDITSGDELYSWYFKTTPPTALAVYHTTLFIGFADGSLRALDLKERSTDVRDVAGHGVAITRIVLSDNLIITSSLDGTACFWDLETGSYQHTVVCSAAGVTGAALQNDELVLASLDGVVRRFVIHDASRSRVRDPMESCFDYLRRARLPRGARPDLEINSDNEIDMDLLTKRLSMSRNDSSITSENGESSGDLRTLSSAS